MFEESDGHQPSVLMASDRAALGELMALRDDLDPDLERNRNLRKLRKALG